MRHTAVETLRFIKNFNVIIKNGTTKKAKRIIFSFGFEVFVILHIFFIFLIQGIDFFTQMIYNQIKVMFTVAPARQNLLLRDEAVFHQTKAIYNPSVFSTTAFEINPRGIYIRVTENVREF